MSLLHETGSACTLSIPTDPSRQLEWLERRKRAIGAFPTNAADLAQLFQQRGGFLPRLRERGLSSEPVDAQLGALLQRAWGHPVNDTYSTRDIGI